MQHTPRNITRPIAHFLEARTGIQQVSFEDAFAQLFSQLSESVRFSLQFLSERMEPETEKILTIRGLERSSARAGYLDQFACALQDRLKTSFYNSLAPTAIFVQWADEGIITMPTDCTARAKVVQRRVIKSAQMKFRTAGMIFRTTGHFQGPLYVAGRVLDRETGAPQVHLWKNDGSPPKVFTCDPNVWIKVQEAVRDESNGDIFAHAAILTLMADPVLC